MIRDYHHHRRALLENFLTLRSWLIIIIGWPVELKAIHRMDRRTELRWWIVKFNWMVLFFIADYLPWPGQWRFQMEISDHRTIAEADGKEKFARFESHLLIERRKRRGGSWMSNLKEEIKFHSYIYIVPIQNILWVPLFGGERQSDWLIWWWRDAKILRI